MTKKEYAFSERTACPACGSTDLETVCSLDYMKDPVRGYVTRFYKLDERLSPKGYAERFNNAKYELCHCGNCQVVFQTYVPNDVLLSEVYSDWMMADGTGAALSQAALSQEDHRHYVSEALRLSAFLLDKTQKSVPSELQALDYGLGKGGFAMALLGVGMKVYGYDFAEDRQKAGSENGVRMISPEDLDTLSFDFINTEQVFEHLPKPDVVFEKLCDALVPGGILKVSVPFSSSMEGGDYTIDWTASKYAKRSVNPVSPLEHLQYFKRPSLNVLAKRHGMREVHIGWRDEINSFVDMARPKRVLRQIGGMMIKDRVRNYYLFQKPS